MLYFFFLWNIFVLFWLHFLIGFEGWRMIESNLGSQQKIKVAKCYKKEICRTEVAVHYIIKEQGT